MNADQYKILKALSQATSRMDVHTFAASVNFTTNQTIELIQELATLGYLAKVNGGFGIAAKGRNMLKAHAELPNECSFTFYLAIGKSLNKTAKSLYDFCSLLSQVPITSIEFHLDRDDFANWLKHCVKDEVLAADFLGTKQAGLKGEPLRKILLDLIKQKYT
jgi:hypothetical protein